MGSILIKNGRVWDGQSFFDADLLTSGNTFAAIKPSIGEQADFIIDAGMAGHVHTDFRLFQEAVACDAAPDIISTDLTCLSAFQRGGNYGMTLCMSLARAMGMTEEDVFRAVTSRPAAALSMGQKDGWGILSVGGCADIAVLEESDNVYDFTDGSENRLSGSTGYRCVLTVADGKLVYRR